MGQKAGKMEYLQQLTTSKQLSRKTKVMVK